MNIFDFIAKPLGQLMFFLYNTVAFHNYGLAIIFFTLIIRICVLPLNIKQYRNTSKMQELQPKMQEIQKRYKNDKEKLNQEMIQLYKENNYNPAGGCLPLIVQMPILFSLYYVVSQPLYYMLGKSSEVIARLYEAIPKEFHTNLYKDITILDYFGKFPGKLEGLSELMKPTELISLKFLGLNLGLVPKYDPNILFSSTLGGQYLPLLILPLLAVATTFISTKISMKSTASTTMSSQQKGMQNTMMYIAPVMTLIFAFQFPAGLALYWTMGYVVQILQQLFMNKYIMKKGGKPIENEKLSGKNR